MKSRLPRIATFFICAVLAISFTALDDVNPLTKGFISHQPSNLSLMRDLVMPGDAVVTETLAAITAAPHATAFDDIVEWVAANIVDSSDEELHGVPDYWQTPAETLALRAGDCEDFAILLCSLLRAYGVPDEQILVAVGTEVGGAWHALLLEHYYSGIWRKVDVQKGAPLVSMDNTPGEASYLDIAYCFNDRESFRGVPSLPDGVYEFEMGYSYYPWEDGAAATFTRSMHKGDELSASVEWLPENYSCPYNAVFNYPWGLNIYDGSGKQVFAWSGGDLAHTFAFTAPADGIYRLEILKRDDAPRCLRLSLSLDDWRLDSSPEGTPLAAGLYEGQALDSYLPDAARPAAPSRELAEVVLATINSARQDAGVASVGAGINSAAQAHALDMLAHRFVSHNGSDGSKPYMRYTLAGGTGFEGECVSRVDVSRQDAMGQDYQSSPAASLERAVESLTNSPDDLNIILDADFSLVNIGIAFDGSELYLVLQFETEFITYGELPVLRDGVLSLAGELAGGLSPSRVQIYYDPLPGPLSAAQLGYAYYALPQRPLAIIRQMSGLPYPSADSKFEWSAYADSRGVPADAVMVPTANGAPALQVPVHHAGIVRYLDADWRVDGRSFALTADLNSIISRFGPGVYTVAIFGFSSPYSHAVSSYALFVQ